VLTRRYLALVMRSKLAPGERPVFWVASAKKDLLAMPEPVVREIGIALGVAQQAERTHQPNPGRGKVRPYWRS
jgi:phage-related protein